MSKQNMRYSYSTPAELQEHLDDFWKHGPNGQRAWRVRFAWRPVMIWDMSKDFLSVAPTGRRHWLKRIVEVYCGVPRNWVAYRDHQMLLSSGQLQEEK